LEIETLLNIKKERLVGELHKDENINSNDTCRTEPVKTYGEPSSSSSSLTQEVGIDNK